MVDNTDSVGSASLTSTWYATSMKMWSEDYLQGETQVCIQVGEDRLGDFQFGLVPGSVDGHVDEVTSESRFTFTWEECDEVHPVSKGEWLRPTGDRAAGEIIRFYKGDRSPFSSPEGSLMLLERAIGPEATPQDSRQDSRPWHAGMGDQGQPILSTGPVSCGRPSVVDPLC